MCSGRHCALRTAVSADNPEAMACLCALYIKPETQSPESKTRT